MNNTLNRWNIRNDQSGSALFISVVILLLASIIGLAALTTAYTELLIAGNDKIQKITFYEADNGTEAGRELTEQNFACWTGFANDTTLIGDAEVLEKAFWSNTEEPTDAEGNPVPYPSDTARDIRIPASDAGPHTNISVFGNVQGLPGGAFQMAAAYEKRGKALATGGASWLYEIHSQHVGLSNSRSTVRIQYRHNIGTEGECLY